uniref:GAF domain-containing protein n=1 Tax=Timema bartmani TaxID=61472 RepID=A0A7R9HXT4_9NEOP|nr:unnamed protein product [Timema bartmani]
MKKKMTQLTFGEVEEWLDSHPELCQDYFLRKTELAAINTWLVAHGFLTINDYVSYSSRRGSVSSAGGSGNTSPNGNYLFAAEDAVQPQLSPVASITPTVVLNGHHKRSNSKRCLRHDFARCKSRSVFRTHEVDGACASKEHPGTSSSRRSSLKDMRKYTSLPPNSINMLSLLIESKIRLPQCAPAPNRSTKRDQLRTQGERDFFLGIVRDVATDLDLKSLSHKTVDNLAVLLDSDGASLFLVDGPRGGRQTLVSKVFDIHSGVSKFLLPGSAVAGYGDNEVQVPWGAGILGHVAETGETVNLQTACEDPRFDDEVDRITGYHTDTLLCMPIRNAYEEVIAVAQVINKNPDIDNGQFTNNDEKV